MKSLNNVWALVESDKYTDCECRGKATVWELTERGRREIRDKFNFHK